MWIEIITALYLQERLIFFFFFFGIHIQITLNHWPALVSALTHSLVNLEDELQLFVGAERCERAVYSLTRLPSLPVILPSFIHLVTAWSFLIVVPSTRAFFYTQTQLSVVCYYTSMHHTVNMYTLDTALSGSSCPLSLYWVLLATMLLMQWHRGFIWEFCYYINPSDFLQTQGLRHDIPSIVAGHIHSLCSQYKLGCNCTSNI